MYNTRPAHHRTHPAPPTLPRSTSHHPTHPHRFDVLTETYNVQKVRKTVNEQYMVAAGLPDTELLKTPQQRALGIASLAFAMLHVMDVVNAQREANRGLREPAAHAILRVACSFREG